MVRIAELKDMRNIYNLISSLGDNTMSYSDFIPIFREQLAETWSTCFVGEINGELVGILNLHIRKRLRHGRSIAEITEFIVKDGFRSLGIGKRLFKIAIELATENCCKQIEASCDIHWKELFQFYSSHGMEQVATYFVQPLTAPVVTLKPYETSAATPEISKPSEESWY